MLTINQIARIYEEGWDLKFRRKPHPKGDKGDCDPSALEMNVYKPAVESVADRDITILHEAIHARNDAKGARSLRASNTAVEREAKETYRKRHYVLEGNV